MNSTPAAAITRRLISYINCCQATVSAVTECACLDDRGTVRVSQPFAGGAFNRGSTCGVVSGGCMAIALANQSRLASDDPRERENVYEELRDYTRWFERGFGSTICRERIGTPLTGVGGIANYLFSGKAYRRCVRHAGPAAERLVDSLDLATESATSGEENHSGYCAAPVLRRATLESGLENGMLEVISVGLDGGVGLSGGLCGALGGVLLAAGYRWGIDPRLRGIRGAYGSYLRNEFNAARRCEEPGLWSVARIMAEFKREFGSLECRDIARRPFEMESDLASFMASSGDCTDVLKWCAARAAQLTRRRAC